MNVLNFLKSRFGSFKKGGESMNEITDISKIQTAVSALMRAETDLWWNVFQGRLPQKATHKNFKPLPVAYVSTAYLAQLVTSEIKFEVADNRLNFFIQKNLIPKLDRITQLTLVGGYTVIKPYITIGGEIFLTSERQRIFSRSRLMKTGV